MPMTWNRQHKLPHRHDRPEMLPVNITTEIISIAERSRNFGRNKTTLNPETFFFQLMFISFIHSFGHIQGRKTNTKKKKLARSKIHLFIHSIVSQRETEPEPHR